MSDPEPVSPIQRYLDGLHRRLSEERGGALATYIPELAQADPGWFGICIATADGHLYEAGPRTLVEIGYEDAAQRRARGLRARGGTAAHAAARAYGAQRAELQLGCAELAPRRSDQSTSAAPARVATTHRYCAGVQPK